MEFSGIAKGFFRIFEKGYYSKPYSCPHLPKKKNRKPLNKLKNDNFWKIEVTDEVSFEIKLVFRYSLEKLIFPINHSPIFKEDSSEFFLVRLATII